MVPKKRKRKENEVTQCCLEIFINIQYLCCVCVGGAGCTNTKIHLFSTFFFLANLTTRWRPCYLLEIAWSKTLLLWRWFLSPIIPVPFLCLTIKGSSCLKMYYVQVQMLKNALMSWRWDSILKNSWCSEGHFPAPWLLVCIAHLRPPTWYPCGKGWHRAKSICGSLFSPQRTLSCFWLQSLKREDLLPMAGATLSIHIPDS